MTVPFRSAADEWEESFRNRREHPEKFYPISTGIGEIDDNVYGGWEKGWLIYLAAQAKIGKTALITTLNAVFERQRLRVLRISLEESSAQIVERQLSNYSKIERGKLRVPSLLSDSEYANALERLAEMKDWYRTLLSGDDSNIEALLKETENQYDVVTIDYLQLMRPKGRFGSEREMIAYSSKMLKKVANKGVLVVAALQLNDDGRDLGSRDPTRDADIKYVLSRAVDETGTADPTSLVMTVEYSRHSSAGNGDAVLYFGGATSSVGGIYADKYLGDQQDIMTQPM